MKQLRFAIALVWLAACGGGGGDSGVSGDTLLTDLSQAEREELCEVVLEAQGGPGTTITCDDFEVMIETVADCAARLGTVSASCTATVDDAEACAEAQGEDPCDFSGLPEACGFLVDCYAQ